MSAASDGLTWRSITASHDSRFMIKGTELSSALCGPHRRFALIEVRCYDVDGFADRRYRLRDATLVTLEEVRNGRRPPIVWEGATYEEAMLAIDRLVGSQV